VTSQERRSIASAIAKAEEGTTGRIAVRIVPGGSVDAFERAKREFERAGLHRHEHGNAALILVAPNARQFAIVGDRALHQRVGDGFWGALVSEIRPYFARGATAEGIIHAVGRIGEQFQRHFGEPPGAGA
jgi:uncharacterized membrane protein